MELDNSKIEMVQRHIEKHLFFLTRKIERYCGIQDDLMNFNSEFRKKINEFSFTPPRTSDIYKLEITSSQCRRMERKKDVIEREIDNSVSIVAGNIAFLIDLCIACYSVDLKKWTVEKIANLVDLRVMASNSSSTDFYFPTATAHLSPYIFKTRFVERSERFASVRNAIRELIN